MATRKTAAAAETAAVKKTPVKKTREVYLQCFGNEFDLTGLQARIEEIWKKDMKKKAADLTDLKIYVKPEEKLAHYVINGEITGSVEL